MDSFLGYRVRTVTASVAGRQYAFIVPDSPDGLLDEPRTLARFERDEYLPYWATLWPGARLLAEFAVRTLGGAGASDPPGRTARRDVLELGCGLALTGIVVASLGHDVILSDYDEDALAFAARNAALNAAATARTMPLDWNATDAGPQERHFDLILAADSLYEARNHAPIARCIAQRLRPDGVAWLSDPGRSVADAFPGAAATAGLQCESVPVPAGGDSAVIAGRIFVARPAARPDAT